MQPTGSSARLARIAHLVETAAARLDVLAEGVEHPRVSEARDRLRAVRSLVAAAAGGPPRWVRYWCSLALLAAVTWATATLLALVPGLGGGWRIAITVVVVHLGLARPISALLTAAGGVVGRRRTRSRASVPPVELPPGDPGAQLAALLWRAHRDLTDVLRQQRPDGGGESVFDRKRRRDVRLASLSLADRHVCVALYAVELWLPRAEER